MFIANSIFFLFNIKAVLKIIELFHRNIGLNRFKSKHSFQGQQTPPKHVGVKTKQSSESVQKTHRKKSSLESTKSSRHQKEK